MQRPLPSARELQCCKERKETMTKRKKLVLAESPAVAPPSPPSPKTITSTTNATTKTKSSKKKKGGRKESKSTKVTNKKKKVDDDAEKGTDRKSSTNTITPGANDDGRTVRPSRKIKKKKMDHSTTPTSSGSNNDRTSRPSRNNKKTKMNATIRRDDNDDGGGIEEDEERAIPVRPGALAIVGVPNTSMDDNDDNKAIVSPLQRVDTIITGPCWGDKKVALLVWMIIISGTIILLCWLFMNPTSGLFFFSFLLVAIVGLLIVFCFVRNVILLMRMMES